MIPPPSLPKKPITSTVSERLTSSEIEQLRQHGKEVSERLRAKGVHLEEGVEARSDTPAFRSWFRESAVIDDNGEPLTVYHRTISDFW